jgi:hypothetical protein
MPSAVEISVNKYIQASMERDPAVRARLIEESFAEDCRIIARQSEIRGRAALVESIGRFLSDPEVLGFRVVSDIDAGSRTYRFRSVVLRRDGRELTFLDTGVLDESGRIVLQLTFAGPLADRSDPIEFMF